MVATEKYVYIFGGYDRMINKYQRVSLRTMDVDMEGNIPLNNFSQFRSVCYDGEDNIYMVQYNDSFSDDDIDYNYFVPKFNSRIDVFNIKNQTFKTLVKFKEDIQMDNRIILQSFIFRNSIYMVCYQKGLVIIEFNLTNKTLKYYLRVTKTEEYRVICACHDGNGNIYIHFRDRFFKMNLVTKTVTELQEFDRVLNSFYSMVFHTFHDRLHVVYLLGGSTFGNHMYIVELNLWRSLTYEYMDRSFRELCGSTLIKL